MSTSVYKPLPGVVPALFLPQADPRAVALARSDIFRGLSNLECALLLQSARCRNFARHERLFEQDQSIRSVFLLESGAVKLIQVTSAGSEVILALLGKGESLEVLGGRAPRKYACSAITMTNCRVLCWDWNKLNLQPFASRIHRNVGHIKSERVLELQGRFLDMAAERVPVRVANALVRLLGHIGEDSGCGRQVFLSREELAQFTGTTLFTISRLVSHWNQLGLVIARRETIIVADSERLLKFVCNTED